MPPSPPRVTRHYLNHHLDSQRWRAFEPRADDIVVTTSYKSGTTWTQAILHRLIFRGDPEAPPITEASPWLDARFRESLDEVTQALREQRHRRFIKSHVPFDGLPWFPQVRYVVVGRDARDVFMSFWNHYSSYTDAMYARLNDDLPTEAGPPLPRANGDALATFRRWIQEGWFPWESEGWPFWGNLRHTRACWEFRELENVLFVHYADLLRDPRGQIARLARFLDLPSDDATLDDVVEATAIDALRVTTKAVAEERYAESFHGGTERFIYKGTNGRWRELLGDEELALYEAAKRRVLPAEAAQWLEGGAL